MNLIFSRRGATLLEVLIAIMVTTMLSGIVILYGSGSRKQVNVYVETVKLAQVILKAKAQAVSIYYDPTSPTCGYGVKIDAVNNAYSLLRYTAPHIEECTDIGSLERESVEQFTLIAGVQFQDTPEQVDEVLFVPPDPRTYLWGNDVAISPGGDIHIVSDDGASDRTISLSTGGQISY